MSDVQFVLQDVPHFLGAVVILIVIFNGLSQVARAVRRPARRTSEGAERGAAE